MRLSPGDVVFADLEPARGNEQGGRRPVLIVSDARYNAMPIGHVLILAITRSDRRLAHHIPIGSEAGLRTPSFVMTESLRAISVTRIIRPLGTARPESMDEVRRWLKDFLTL